MRGGTNWLTRSDDVVPLCLKAHPLTLYCPPPSPMRLEVGNWTLVCQREGEVDIFQLRGCPGRLGQMFQHSLYINNTVCVFLADHKPFGRGVKRTAVLCFESNRGVKTPLLADTPLGKLAASFYYYYCCCCYCCCCCFCCYTECLTIHLLVEEFEFGIKSLSMKGYKSKSDVTKDKVSLVEVTKLSIAQSPYVMGTNCSRQYYLFWRALMDDSFY